MFSKTKIVRNLLRAALKPCTTTFVNLKTNSAGGKRRSRDGESQREQGNSSDTTDRSSVSLADGSLLTQLTVQSSHISAPGR